MTNIYKLNQKKTSMEPMRSPRIIPFVLLLILSTTLHAQSYFNPLLMNQLGLSHSRDVALSGANSSDYSTAMNTFSNPANQSGFVGLKLSGSFAAIATMENRSFPAIDQFGDVVTNNVYVVSQGLQNAFSGGATWGDGSFALSIASTPFITPAFFFKEEIRGSLYAPNINRDPLIGYHHIEQSGVIQATGFSYGFNQDNLSFGAALRFLHGVGLQNQMGVSVIDDADTSALASGTSMLMSEEWDLDNLPIVGQLGAILDLGMHWRVSASYQTSYVMKSTRQGALPFYDATEGLPLIEWTSDSLDLTIDIPARLEVGLRMKPANSLPTSVYISLAYQDWTQYAVSYGDSLLDASVPFEYPMQETFTLSGGIEHWINENVPFRAGFSWAESPLDSELSQAILSGGSGWKSGPLQFDVAVQLLSVGYRYFDIFVPVGMSANSYENVRESKTNYSISVSYSL
ncbi:MAG: hypothetical protein K9M55_08165 [Candidatus Marinimicrobia bacterium]|nr:hypothetical protein [Candidatus Neomarinimicrobiota bacterium]MCF7922662.1 hypothetical protein [Candidatus Neomarinimicrobiota bacterium]